MLAIGIMVEGQNGLTWPLWRSIVAAAEDLGYASIFRSDHFTNPRGPDLPSLELWPALIYVATGTKRVEFGPLVSPVTFRHPSVVARMAAAVDDLSDGRLVLGLGAGWQEREHNVFGVPFPPRSERYVMLREYLDVVTGLLCGDEPVTYSGGHYQLNDAVLLPRPQRRCGPRLLVGGNGSRRTLPLAAEFAQEWNANFISPSDFGDLNKRLDELLEQRGRNPGSVRRSIMLGTLYADTNAAFQSALQRRGQTLADIQNSGVVYGTPDMWVDQLAAYRDAGAEEIMLQWLDLENLAPLEVVAQEVLPKFS